MSQDAPLKLTDATVRKLALTPEMPDGRISSILIFRALVSGFGEAQEVLVLPIRFGKDTRKANIALTTEKTADQAREMAKDIFGHLRLGRDPVADANDERRM